MTKAIESRSQAYIRITESIRSFVNHSVRAAKLVLEAKSLEIWKEKWSSWQEYCEKEFGKSRQRVYELLEVAGTIDEIKSVCLADIESGKNKEILDSLNRRQVAELKGLYPLEKAEVLVQAIRAEGGKSPKPSTIATARQACAEFGDGTYRGHSMSDFYVEQREEIDTLDKMPRPTREDVALAKEFGAYPKSVSFTLVNEGEEKQVREFVNELFSKRSASGTSCTILDVLTVQTIPLSGTIVHNAIAKVCQAYKEVTKKQLAMTGADRGQLRRLLESGITLEEFIATGKKAWVSNGFLSQHSHQISMFVKHYGNIRNEVAGPTHRGNPRPGADRNAGTANQNRIGQYDGVGRVL